MSNKIEKKQITTVQQLFEDVDLQVKKDQLMVFLNQNPPDTWLKKNPYANNSLYVPIDKIEWMLNRFFGGYRIEILREGSLFNSVYVVVRLFYIDPISGKEVFQDGMGAKEVQVDKGSSPSQLERIKNGAIERGLPNAESNAIKDAAHKIGRVFGSDLNRKDLLPINTDNKLQEIAEKKKYELKKRVDHFIKSAIDRNELDDLRHYLLEFPELQEQFENKEKQLNNEK